MHRDAWKKNTWNFIGLSLFEPSIQLHRYYIYSLVSYFFDKILVIQIDIKSPFGLVEEMQEVFRNIHKLKKSKFFIRGFYSELTTNRRSALAPLMSHMKREKGLKCSLINDAIACGPQRFTVQTAKNLEYCQTAVTKTDGNIYVFAGQLSILSNFYECDIEIGGDKFNSVEQLFQCTKAELHNNSPTVKQIMSTDNPVQQKRLGGILKINDDTWDSRDVMKKAVRAKFQQNPDLKGYIKRTAPMTLVHANAYDQHWANGLALTSMSFYMYIIILC